MNSKHIGATSSVAWPSAQVAVMGAQGAVNIIHRRDISSADDPDTNRAELVAEYTEKYANPYAA